MFQTAPVMLVPLDATTHVQVTEEFVQRLEQDRQTPEADFVYRLLASDPEHVRSGTFFFWAPLAAVSLAVEGVVSYEQKKVRVVEEEGESTADGRRNPRRGTSCGAECRRTARSSSRPSSTRSTAG